ncbi:hypothetical protein ABW20_dc0110695 [Dactylellina cionopaga]|nr:hypothetical protein ABW20_dc0110695 [Dactylellina cionopaga]
MAAAIGGDQILQVLRRLQRRNLQNSQQAKDIRRQPLRRQDVPPSEGVGVTTLVVVETLATPSGTLTQVVTVAPTPPPQSESEPNSTLSDDYTPAPTPTSNILEEEMATTSAQSGPNATRSNTSKAAMTSSPTTAQRSSSPTTTGAVASKASSSGIDIKALVPAIVGGAIFLIIVAFLLGYCIRRRKHKREAEEPDPEVVNEIERGYGSVNEGVYGTGASRKSGGTNEKQPSQTASRNVPDINIDPSHARNRSLSKGTSQSREGLLQSDYGKLGPNGSENEKRHAMAMFRRSTAQDSATIPHHLRNLRPESVSTDGLRSPGLDGDHFSRSLNQPPPDRISKIGMALSTSDKSVQDDNISTLLQEDPRPTQPRAPGFQNSGNMFFEETPPLYSVAPNAFFGGGATVPKSRSKSTSRPELPDFGTVGSTDSSNKSRFAGRSDLATPSPPGTPTRSSRDRDRDTSTSSRRSSRRGSGIFGLAAATLAVAPDSRRARPKSWDRKSRRWDRKRHSRGRGVAAPTGLEKKKPNKSRSRSRGNAMWTAWFDSSSEGEDDDGEEDVVEPIPLPGGIVTSKSQKKKRVIFNSTSDISEHPTVSSSKTLTNSTII